MHSAATRISTSKQKSLVGMPRIMLCKRIHICILNLHLYVLRYLPMTYQWHKNTLLPQTVKALPSQSLSNSARTSLMRARMSK